MKYKFIARFILIIPLFFVSCASSENLNREISLPLENTKWILKTLNGKKIFTPESKKDIFIQFSSAGKRANGFAGCNNFSGTYTQDKNNIAIGPLASTEMFCESMMETENGFFNVLGSTEKFNIKGKYLLLYNSEKIVAKFEGSIDKN